MAVANSLAPCQILGAARLAGIDFARRRHSRFGSPFASPLGGMLNPISQSLERYMDLLSARQKLVASNIANADTPGYKAQDIDFQFEFVSAMEAAGAPRTRPNVFEVSGLVTRNDGNNVSMDREARLVSENALRFNLASSLYKAQLRALRTAIQEGKNG
jgi:flagellar basal-body rod protein FlgB